MKRSKIVIGVFIAFVLIVLTIVLLACTVFIVRDISVKSEVNSQLLDSDAIIESSGLSKGHSIVSINKSKVKANIEKDNPYVEVLNVVRVFPSKIVIEVTVRTGIMTVLSTDGGSAAVIDSSMKILDVIPSTDQDKSGVTSVEGLTYNVPFEGVLSTVGKPAEFSDPVCGEILRDIAESASANSDLSAASFATFFKKISFVKEEGGTIKVYIKTIKGVTFVLDNSLSTKIYDQLFICMFVYTSDEMDTDLSKGYITLVRTEDKIAYNWVETLPDVAN